MTICRAHTQSTDNDCSSLAYRAEGEYSIITFGSNSYLLGSTITCSGSGKQGSGIMVSSSSKAVYVKSKDSDFLGFGIGQQECEIACGASPKCDGEDPVTTGKTECRNCGHQTIKPSQMDLVEYGKITAGILFGTTFP